MQLLELPRTSPPIGAADRPKEAVAIQSGPLAARDEEACDFIARQVLDRDAQCFDG